MKSYEELLSDIEEDMELMGSSHIVYSMEEDGIVTDYDYLPSDSCTISRCSIQKFPLIQPEQIKMPRN